MRYLIALLLTLVAIGCTIENNDEDAMNKMGSDGLRDVASPPRRAWSTAGKLLPGNTVNTVSLQANFPQAGEHTVQFNLFPNQQNIQQKVNTRVEAIIRWSVEGNTIERRVTVSDGMSISGNAQGVQVVCTDSSTFNVLADVDEYTVGITVAPGSRGNYMGPPTFSAREGMQSAAGAVAMTFSIPEDLGATSFWVYVKTIVTATGAIAATSSHIELRNISTTPIMAQGILTDDNHGTWWPLPAGTNEILITNPAAANTVTAMLIYGIDG